MNENFGLFAVMKSQSFEYFSQTNKIQRKKKRLFPSQNTI